MGGVGVGVGQDRLHGRDASTLGPEVEIDSGVRPGVTADTAARMKELEREVRELRQANEILKKASAYFAQAELDRPWRK